MTDAAFVAKYYYLRCFSTTVKKMLLLDSGSQSFSICRPKKCERNHLTIKLSQQNDCLGPQYILTEQLKDETLWEALFKEYSKSCISP